MRCSVMSPSGSRRARTSSKATSDSGGNARSQVSPGDRNVGRVERSMSGRGRGLARVSGDLAIVATED